MTETTQPTDAPGGAPPTTILGRLPWSGELDVPSTRVTLLRTGLLEHEPLTDHKYRREPETPLQPGETYVADPQLRFWNPKPIPVGFVWVHVQGDPEPVTTREPRGYGAEILDFLLGGWFPHLFGATRYESPGNGIDWRVLGKRIGIAAIAFLIAYFAYTSGWLGFMGLGGGA